MKNKEIDFDRQENDERFTDLLRHFHKLKDDYFFNLEKQQAENNRLGSKVLYQGQQQEMFTHFINKQMVKNEQINTTFENINDRFLEMLQKLNKLKLDHDTNIQMQNEENKNFVSRMGVQQEQMEVFASFMNDQQGKNQQMSNQLNEHKSEVEQVKELLKNQEKLNYVLSENITAINSKFDTILASLKNHENTNEQLMNDMEAQLDKQEDVKELVNKQVETLRSIMYSIETNKEKYDILFDYVKSQDSFNHKLFEFLCEHFEKSEEAESIPIQHQ